MKASKVFSGCILYLPYVPLPQIDTQRWDSYFQYFVSISPVVLIVFTRSLFFKYKLQRIVQSQVTLINWLFCLAWKLDLKIVLFIILKVERFHASSPLHCNSTIMIQVTNLADDIQNTCDIDHLPENSWEVPLPDDTSLRKVIKTGFGLGQFRTDAMMIYLITSHNFFINNSGESWQQKL